MASIGQASTQTPQSLHEDASIAYLPSLSEIASTGQALTQAPQPVHSSLIL